MFFWSHSPNLDDQMIFWDQAPKNTEFLAIADGRLGEWRPAKTGMRRMVASCHCQHGHFQRHSRLWIKKASTILGTMKDTVIQAIMSILNNWEFTIYTYIIIEVAKCPVCRLPNHCGNHLHWHPRSPATFPVRSMLSRLLSEDWASLKV
jgi:hypothetical protein